VGAAAAPAGMVRRLPVLPAQKCTSAHSAAAGTAHVALACRLIYRLPGIVSSLRRAQTALATLDQRSQATAAVAFAAVARSC
jgi:hypothetical protein